MVREAVKAKFGGSAAISAKTTPRYPQSAEREFQRVGRAYMKLLNAALKNHLPAIIEACKQERSDSRFDSSGDFERRLRKEMQKIAEELEQATGDFGLEELIDRIAKLTSAQSTREWKRAVKKTLGINILDDYYKGEIYEESLKQWVSQNILQIKSIPSNTLGELEKIILDGYRNGSSLRELKKAIQDEYDVNKRKAEFLARDQVATLNAQITKLQQTDAGVTRYKWSTSLDSRIRECHAELHGKIISWDNPPEMWYDTKHGRVYTGGTAIRARTLSAAVAQSRSLI